MATCELQQLLDPEVEATHEARPSYDTTIAEIPKQFVEVTASSNADASTPLGFVPTVKLKQIVQIEDEAEDSSGFDPYNRV